MSWQYEPGGRVRVFIDQHLPPLEVLPMEDGIIAGSFEAIEQLALQWNPKLVLLNTSPRCLFDPTTGQLLDLWEDR